MRGKRIIVTGAGGFIGEALAGKLIGTGASVLGLGRNALPDGDGLPFRYMQCDLRDMAQVQKVFLDFSPEIVYHLASNADSKDSFRQIRSSVFDNLILTLNVLEAFALCPGHHLFVYGDSTKVYGDCEPPYRQELPSRPLCSYAIAKAASWEYCKLFQLVHCVPAVSIRPTLTYGPLQRINLVAFVIDSLLGGAEEIVLSGGDQTRDLLYIDDCVEAFIRTGNQPPEKVAGQVINIGGGTELSVLEIAEEIARIMEKDVRIITEKGLRRPTEINRCLCDNAEAYRLMSWQPATPLREGMIRTIEHRKSKINGN